MPSYAYSVQRLKGLQRRVRTQETGSMREGKTKAAPLARKKEWERKLRHRSRTEKLKARPVCAAGRVLDDDFDERSWLDW